MIKISKAKEDEASVLALLGRITYIESHGPFITNKNDLVAYIDRSFSVAQTVKDLTHPDQLFYIIYVDDLPVGYAKIVLNASHASIPSKHTCRLERIYILSEFIPLRIGYQLLRFVENVVKDLAYETMWLSVYVKNERAIKFYNRNEFLEVGQLDFLVNGTNYPNLVLAKTYEYE